MKFVLPEGIGEPMQERRRINQLNAEYEKPIFSNKRLFVMTVIFGIGVAAISGVLLS